MNCEFCFNIIRGPAVRVLGVTDPCKALIQKSCDNVPLILVLFARPRVTRAAENEQQVSKLKNRFNKRFVIKDELIGIRYLFFSVADPVPFRPWDPEWVFFRIPDPKPIFCLQKKVWEQIGTVAEQFLSWHYINRNFFAVCFIWLAH